MTRRPLPQPNQRHEDKRVKEKHKRNDMLDRISHDDSLLPEFLYLGEDTD